MAQNTEELDQERTARIRQMLAEQNPEMVQQRYGEDVTGTPEYQEAEQRLQREQQKRRETIKTMREQAVADQAGDEDLVAVPGAENGKGTVHDPKLMANPQDAERMVAEQEAERQRQITERRERQAEVQRQQELEQTDRQRDGQQAEGQSVDQRGQTVDEPDQTAGDPVAGTDRQRSASDRFNDRVQAAEQRNRDEQTQDREQEQDGSREDDEDPSKSASDRFNDQVKTAEERDRQRGGLSR